MSAYYNENDPKAAAWLRELIKAGLIAPGDVDERDVWDVTPKELMGYDQHHFFAGIGVWSYALRCVGWSDDRPVWTGSCPCQPFSAAGKGGGFADDRHVWPAWFWLISECRPGVVFGEQVASRDGLAWLDLVSADMEGAGYTVGALDLCAAGLGAPHIRQRLFFVADASGHATGQHAGELSGDEGKHDLGAEAGGDGVGDSGHPRLLGNTPGRGLGMCGSPPGSSGRTALPGGPGGMGLPGGAGHQGSEFRGAHGERRPQPAHGTVAEPGPTGGLGNPGSERRQQDAGSSPTDEEEDGRAGRDRGEPDSNHKPSGPGPTNGFWRDAEWIACRDGKARPTEPGTFPLVDGAPARVGRLRGYGNAIVAPVAEAFVKAYMEREAT